MSKTSGVYCVEICNQSFTLKHTEAFEVKKSIHRQLENRKRRIQRRLDRKNILVETFRPVFSSAGIKYEVAERSRGIAAGGMGAMQLLAEHVHLAENINLGVHVLKRHLPYHESDHVLNIALNLLAGGTCLEHIELRRNDETFLDALNVASIPDPTTAGDFCRRFDEADIHALMEAINESRLTVWKQQPDEFFEEALIDGDGTIVETTGECKQGMDISYNGKWGYHPLLISLANTGELLYLSNRSGNRPSHEGAAAYFDRARALCRRAGFRKITLRGDTDFTQTKELDRWDEEGTGFLFGANNTLSVRLEAELLENKVWERLERKPKYTVKTKPRRRPENVKEKIVILRHFANIRLKSEDVAEFTYTPTACKKTYRMIVVRKNLSVASGERVLFPNVRYFFYLTNDWETPAEQLVLKANGRCNQENSVIEQHKNDVRSLRAPLDTLQSNWTYMVIASLAASLKIWSALLLPETGRWKQKHQREKQAVLTMDFSTFRNAFVQLPCQIVKTGRRLVYRLLSWNPWQHVFFRLVEHLQGRLLC